MAVSAKSHTAPTLLGQSRSHVFLDRLLREIEIRANKLLLRAVAGCR